MTPNTTSQSGNVLIYILGAIFLLGILVVMVKGSGSGGANIDEETLILRVQEIQEYGNELEAAVGFIMQNGHSEVDIRFAHPDADSGYGDITDTPSRQVFSRNGGGATYREPPNGIQTTTTPWFFSGHNGADGVGTTCVGAECSDLVAMLNYVTKDFCVLLNEKNNIENAAGDPPQDQGFVHIATPFTAFVAGNRIQDQGTGYLFGKLEGCFEGDSGPAAGTYHYYRVLLAR